MSTKETIDQIKNDKKFKPTGEVKIKYQNGEKPDYEESQSIRERSLTNFVSEGNEVIKSLESLKPYEQDFVMFYSTEPKLEKAVQRARSANKLINLSVDERVTEGEYLLTKPTVVKALDDIRKGKAKITNAIVAQYGYNYLEQFEKSMTKTETLDSLDRRLKELEANILILESTPNYDMKMWMKMVDMQRGLLASKLEVEKEVRKNMETILNITSTSKEKTVVRAGSIQINVGGSDHKHIPPIGSGDVLENNTEEIFDFDPEDD